MFVMGSRLNVITFEVDPKSNMAALSSDLLIHFELVLKKDCRDLLQP